MTTRVLNLAPRKPVFVSEEAARKLEETIEAKGEGALTQVSAAPALQARELTSSIASRTAPVAVPESVEASTIELPALVPAPTAVVAPIAAAAPAPAAAPARNTVSSRARSTTKSQARNLPATGIGTFHNPRVRKMDGVKTRSTTVHLPIELAEKLAVHCARTGLRQSQVITEAVEAILS